MQKNAFSIALILSILAHIGAFGFAYISSLDEKPQEIKPTPITISLYEEKQAEPAPQPAKPMPKKEPKKIVKKEQKQIIKQLPIAEPIKDAIPVKTVQAPPPPPAVTAVQDTPKPKIQSQQPKGETDEVKRYLAKIRKALQENLEYPYYAKKSGIEGTTVVNFCVRKDGSMPLHSLKIVKGSGHAILDRHALETVQNSAPFPPPPNGELEVTIPVAFTIKS